MLRSGDKYQPLFLTKEDEAQQQNGNRNEDTHRNGTANNLSGERTYMNAGEYTTPFGISDTRSDMSVSLAENIEQIPQRPQDLIDKVSFGVPEVNLTSSAQYRKSYAFKIWREKGFFPYKLAKEQQIEDRRQKSKKHLNALKIQRERQNEEAWREFKKSRINQDKRAQKNRRSQNEEKSNNKEQASLTPVLHEEEKHGQNMAHQGSISNYFKTKKDAAQKLQNNSKSSIPTSVIHVSNTPNIPQNVESTSPTENELSIVETQSDAIPSTNVVTSNIPSKMSNVRSTPANEEPASTNNMENAFNERPPPNSTDFADIHLVVKSVKSTKVGSTELASDLVNTSDQKEYKIPKNDTLTALSKEQNKTDATSCTSDLVAVVKSTLGEKYSKENITPIRHVSRNRKRRRDGEGRQTGKQGKLTVFAKLDETIATNLADGIHNVNSEYFPISALAKKAAKETNSTIQNEAREIDREKKVQEIGRARLLLKELFDVTLESNGDHEMKTFDAESRSFGRQNILNHLSLLDRYFDEFQKKLSTVSTSSLD